MRDAAPRGITLGQLTVSFVPFALLLSAALLAGELQVDIGMSRTVYTIWATAALVIPAFCAFTLPGDSPRKRNLWLLFWTFSYVVYVVHVLYAVFSVYHGSSREFLEGQKLYGAVLNVVLTTWWSLDLLLAWLGKRQDGWVHRQRVWAHWFIGLNFLISTLYFRPGFVSVLGGSLALSVLICFAYRWDAQRRAPQLSPSVPQAG